MSKDIDFNDSYDFITRNETLFYKTFYEVFIVALK